MAEKSEPRARHTLDVRVDAQPGAGKRGAAGRLGTLTNILQGQPPLMAVAAFTHLYVRSFLVANLVFLQLGQAS